LWYTTGSELAKLQVKLTQPYQLIIILMCRLIQVLVQALGVNVDLTFIMATVDIFSDWPSTKTQASAL